MTSNNIGPEGITFFCKCPFLKTLKCLYLTSNNIGEDGWEILYKCESLKNLKSLYLNKNGIGKERILTLRRKFLSKDCIDDKDC